MTTRFMVLTFALATGLLAASCAGTSAEARKESQPRGEMALYVDDYAYRAASFGDREVAAGKMGGPSWSTLVLTPQGTWKGQVASFGQGGNPTSYTFKRDSVGAPTYKSSLVEFRVEGSRITGLGTDVTFTKVDGGFRLSGTWLKDNVDLTVTRDSARSQQVRYGVTAPGRYVAASTPPLAIQLAGEAANLDDPKFPEVALTVLALGWGVHPFP
ncbi:MAG: hypothetical protein WB493_10870 [Anaeromyxobacteraceae bacterium]